MKTRRADLIVLLCGLGAFALMFWGWASFLETDRCIDWGGVMRDGICVDARYPVPSFWDSPLGYKLFALIPPAIGTAIVVAVVGSLKASPRKNHDA